MLESLLEPNYPRAALGLEQESVTALALQKEGRGRFGIKQAATIVLPERLLTPSFTERNIVSTEEMLVMIDEAVTKAGLRRQKRWSVSLPSNTARTAILTLETEPASANELNELLDWKAENNFGVPAGELRISQRKISPDAGGKTRYFATAVKLSVIDEYETLFERNGWHAGLILPRAVSEAKWLVDTKNSKSPTDSLLISSQHDGFTAFILRGDEPTVVRNVTCTESERDDEIYRLLMFYRDRMANDASANFLEKLLVVGRDFAPGKLTEIANEALGKALNVLRPEDVGLSLPVQDLSFDDLAAPAGLATYGWK
jgi:Tfp pilus assembly PilM family ATPase